MSDRYAQALTQIAFLRKAGPIPAGPRARALIEQMESIAIAALSPRTIEKQFTPMIGAAYDLMSALKDARKRLHGAGMLGLDDINDPVNAALQRVGALSNITESAAIARAEQH